MTTKRKPKTMPAARKPRRTGRPTLFSQALAADICQLVAEGRTLRQIAERPAMPDKATMIRWLHANPDFCDQYARARETQALVLGDEILDIADDSTNDYVAQEDKDGRVRMLQNDEAIARSRMRIDARKWLMGKLAPKRFGEKIQIGGDPANPAAVGVVVIPAKQVAAD